MRKLRRIFEGLESYTTQELMNELERRKRNKKTNNVHPVAISYMKDIDEAISSNGQDYFFEYGLNIDTQKLENLDIEEVAKILSDILSKYKYYSEIMDLNCDYAAENFISCIFVELQYKTWFDNLFDFDDRFEKLY